MRFGSLFSGIGGMDLGLERAGLSCAWQIENDPYACKILAKHWPDVTRYGDIREVDFGTVEPVELLAGGFPCQDLSYAGKGLGLSGERSGLWTDFKRAIRVVRPRYVLVENVPGLLTRGMGAVLGDLASLGYDAEWQSIPAAAVGAPHLRWRVFIIAHARGQQHQSDSPEIQWAPTSKLPASHTERNRRQRAKSSGSSAGMRRRSTHQDTEVSHANGAGLGERRRTEPVREELDTSECLGEAVANPMRHGLFRSEKQDSCEGRQQGRWEQAQRRDNTDGRRVDERRPLADADRDNEFGGSSDVQMGRQRIEREAEEDTQTLGDQRAVESHLGRNPDGFSPRLDRTVNAWEGDWERGIPRVAKGVSHRVDRLRGLGNAVVPAVAEYLGRVIMEHVCGEIDGCS